MDLLRALKNFLKRSSKSTAEETSSPSTHEPKKNITDIGSLKFIAHSDYEKSNAQ